ncbi:MAG: HD domain-containing protein [Firmicutes bacterium]|nr:HD domain-containing protein [Bacillota bacterium]
MDLESGIPALVQDPCVNMIHKYFRAVERLSDLTCRPTSVQGALEGSIDVLMDLLQVKQASIMLLDPLTNELSIRVCRGFPAFRATNRFLRAGEGIAGQVLLRREPYLATSKERSSSQCNQSLPEFDAALYIPLVVGHEARGLITLGSVWEKRFFSAAEIKISSALAGYIALALENTRLGSEVSGLSLNFLKSLAMAIDARDSHTRMHSMRVTRYAIMTGMRMGLSQDSIELLRRGALLHDIGKIGLPDNILLKPGKLTTSESEALRRHPEIGAKILGPEPFQPIVPLVLYHHERYDGNGYPHGLKGTEIPQGARIIAAADAFEAITGDRPYRPALSYEAAARELQQNAGSQFDLEVVNAFMGVLNEEIRKPAPDR